MEELRVEANGHLGPIDSSRIPRYAGAATFARLPRLDQVQQADIAVVGVPFDSGVSYRPGARFGANHVREASRLLRPYNPAWDVSPFEEVQVADAGDMAVNPFNINEAIETIQQNALDLTASGTKLVTIGGDHTIALPLLRAAAERAGGPVAMLHFDAHLDTWDTYFGAEYTHGTPFRRAVEEGILDTEAHLPRGHPRPALRQEGPRRRPPLRLRHRHLAPTSTTRASARWWPSCATGSATRPLYVSIDIDVLDPAHAPGTGTPEAGGITSRELLEIIRGFRGMNLIGADVVEVAPAYDHAEITGVAGSHVAYELVSLMADNAAGGGSRNGYAASGAGLRTAVAAAGCRVGPGVLRATAPKSGALPGAGAAHAGPATPACATAGTSSSKPSSALGATTVFGIPGQHALGLFDALSRSALHFVSSRVENNSAFAADGYSRATGEVGVLFLSTGPGALTSLAGLQEAYATGVPMVVIASQIPLEGLGARRKGMLHQLDDQKASAANVTKSQRLIQHASGIPSAIQDAWTEAISSPQGPVWVEVPQNVLLDPIMVPPVEDALAEALDNPPRGRAGQARPCGGSPTAERPAIIAGGGARRGKAERGCSRIAEKLRAPVVCSPGGNGAFPWNHELSLQSWIEDRHVTDVLEDADVLLVVGSSLGEVTSNYFTFEPRGRIIQIDAEPRVLESNRPGAGHPRRRRPGSARARRRPRRGAAANPPDWHGQGPEQLVKDTLAKVQARLDSQDLAKERAFMADIREAVPRRHADVLGHDHLRLLGLELLGLPRRPVPFRPGRRRPRLRLPRRHRRQPSASASQAKGCPGAGRLRRRLRHVLDQPNWPPPASTTCRSPG